MNNNEQEFTPKKTLFALSSVFPYRTCQRTYLLDQHTEQIRYFQYMFNFLNTYYNWGDPIPMTGNLDQNTLDAVRAFQEQVGICVDGKIGCKTWDTAKSLAARLHMYYMCMVTENAIIPLPIYTATSYHEYEYDYDKFNNEGYYGYDYYKDY
jgi:hypothetical protein